MQVKVVEELHFFQQFRQLRAELVTAFFSLPRTRISCCCALTRAFSSSALSVKTMLGRASSKAATAIALTLPISVN